MEYSEKEDEDTQSVRGYTDSIDTKGHVGIDSVEEPLEKQAKVKLSWYEEEGIRMQKSIEEWRKQKDNKLVSEHKSVDGNFVKDPVFASNSANVDTCPSEPGLESEMEEKFKSLAVNDKRVMEEREGSFNPITPEVARMDSIVESVGVDDEMMEHS
jgi:hypothetical protein